MPFRPASLPLAVHVQRSTGKPAGRQARVDWSRYRRRVAALKTSAPVIDCMGLRNFGAHTNNAEYSSIWSIEPRLYVVTRLIIDMADKGGVVAPAAR